MKELRGVTVGAGFFADFQLDGWSRVKGARIDALCDLDPEKAKGLAARYGVPRTYTAYAKMLDTEKPDFVDIVTRPDTHLHLVREAASRGIAVLCQKPMAPTFAECVAMVEACEKSKVPLMINENWRWQPWHRKIKDILTGNGIGKVFHAGFRVRTGDGRGPLPYRHQPYFIDMPRFLVFEMGVHFIDTLRFFLGDIQRVYAHTKRLNTVISGEDFAVLHFTFDQGVTAVVDANRITEPAQKGPALSRLQVEGDGGYLCVDENGRTEVYPLDAKPQVYTFDIETGYKGDSCRLTQQHFADAMREGLEFETSGRTYLKTVAAVEACYQSAQRQEPIILATNAEGVA